MEDDPLLRITIIADLEDDGFQVFEAGNAAKAIKLLDTNPSIQLTFTDIDMPGAMNGLLLAAHVRDRWPPIKIIVTSGYHRITTKDLPVEGTFIRKPYLP